MTVEAVTLVTAMPSPVSLRDRFSTTPAPEEVTLLLRALPPLCAALAELHDRGLSHRALGPGTILAPKPGPLALRDLGLCAVPPAPGERDDPHRAPEQAAGGGVPPGPATDVHRLARVLYELVTGRPAGRRDRQVAPSVLNPAVPAAADAVFRDAFAADPARRPPVRAFAARLVAATREPGSPRSPGRRRSRPTDRRP
jgi:serine/threonine protein kinase